MPAVETPGDALIEAQVRDLIWERESVVLLRSVLITADPVPPEARAKAIWDRAWASAREYEAVKLCATALAADDKVIALAPQGLAS